MALAITTAASTLRDASTTNYEGPDFAISRNRGGESFPPPMNLVLTTVCTGMLTYREGPHGAGDSVNAGCSRRAG